MTEFVVTDSRYAFGETVDRLTTALAAGGATLFARIDQSAAAASVGLTLRPTMLLIFGNPKGGTPLMNAHPPAALDLPLKLLIWEEDGAVRVAHVPLSTIAARYSIAAGDPMIATLQHAIDALVAGIAD